MQHRQIDAAGVLLAIINEAWKCCFLVIFMCDMIIAKDAADIYCSYANPQESDMHLQNNTCTTDTHTYTL